MNLSFSTNRWSGIELDGFIDIAKEYKFKGIEIHNVKEIKSSPTDIYHKLIENRIKISCIDMICDISGDDKEEIFSEFSECVDVAKALHTSYIRVKAAGNEENVIEFIKKALPVAEKNGIIILVETVGIYADTKKLSELLNTFACDNLAALWDLHYPYREYGEKPEETIKNLGAYVRHIHMKDSDGKDSYSLVGEGSLPIADVMNALRSVNYNEFISIEWDPDWDNDISDMDIIFPHFVSYMARFENLSRAKQTLYENKRGTGKFVWKKGGRKYF